MRRYSLLAVAGAAVLTSTLLSPGAADAAGSGQLAVKGTVATGYVGPLQFEMSKHGVYVADAFRSLLFKVGTPDPIAFGRGTKGQGDLAGVTVDPRSGDVIYTDSSGDHSDTALNVLRGDRVVRQVSLSHYEARVNPDGRVRYGIASASDCAREALDDLGYPTDYTGGVDSHPYAVAMLPDGSYAVADAGGNDILRVTPAGRVSTLAVLPSVRWTIPLSYARANQLPDCVAGTVYRVEGVPTDVEYDGHGGLLVTSLPGLDAPDVGRVYRLDVATRSLRLLAGGFDLPTNLAVTKAGRIYVAELGAGRVSTIYRGKRATVMTLPDVVGIEAAGNHLYVSTAPALNGSNQPGSILELGPAR